MAAGSMFVRNGFFTDPGADSWTATVDYGDGNGAVPLALNPAQRFSLQHRYVTPGIYTVTVSVRDDDGGVGMTSFRVTVLSDLAVGSASDPVRREKIAAAKRGKLRPPEVIEKMRTANLG